MRVSRARRGDGTLLINFDTVIAPNMLVFVMQLASKVKLWKGKFMHGSLLECVNLTVSCWNMNPLHVLRTCSTIPASVRAFAFLDINVSFLERGHK